MEITDIDNDRLFVNDVKVKSITKDMQKQLDIVRISFMNINNSLNQLVNQKVIKGSRLDAVKNLSKKAKSQATATEKLKDTLIQKSTEDMQLYPIQLLDERIAELEKKIENLING